MDMTGEIDHEYYYFTACVVNQSYDPADRSGDRMKIATFFLRERILGLNPGITDCTFHPSGAGCDLSVDNTVNLAWLDDVMMHDVERWAIGPGKFFPLRRQVPVILPGIVDLKIESYTFSRNITGPEDNAERFDPASIKLDEFIRHNPKILRSRWVESRVFLTTAPEFTGPGVKGSVLRTIRWANHVFDLFPGGLGAPKIIAQTSRSVTMWND